MPKLKKKSDQNDNILSFFPEGEFCFSKVVKAFQQGKFELAGKWLRKAVDIEPQEPLYKCQLSIIYTEIGFYHAANELLMNVLNDKQAHYPDCYYLLANNYAHLGLLNEAKRYALLYLDEVPDGGISKDAKDLLELIDIEDEDTNPFSNEEDELLMYQETAFRHVEQMEWEKALHVLEEMMALIQNHTIAKNDYAVTLYNLGREEEAIDRELTMLEEHPNTLNSYMNLAVFYYDRNEMDKGEACIQSLLSVYPILEQQKLRIAVTLAKTNHVEAALPRFEHLNTAYAKHHPSYYRWFSWSLYSMNQVERAQKLWAKGCKAHSILQTEEVPW